MHTRAHDRWALRVAIGLTGSFFIIELIGGWLTNSLALVSDAAHMFTDVAALSLSLFALWVASRPPSESKTFGYQRAEILAALVNGLALCLVVVWIVHEAYERLRMPEAVHSGAMMLVATGGLLINVVCAWLLVPRSGTSLNLRAAFLHVLADLLGSLGAIAAGAIMLMTGWFAADAVAAIFIAILVLVSAWRLIREALDILMEAVPPHIDFQRLREELEHVPGTNRVHDLHVWTLTTGQYALSAHAVIDGSIDGERILEQMRQLLEARFDVRHVTVQLESAQPCEPETVHV